MAHSPLFNSFIRALQKARQLNFEAEGKPLPLPASRLSHSRRRLLKTATFVGATALLSKVLTPTISWGQAKEGSKSQVVIIGGGLAGLNAAYQLKKAGITATLYEATSQVGGRVRSVKNAIGKDIVVDLGGSFINTDHEDMLTLARELGITLVNQIENAKKLNFPSSAYYFNQKLIPEAEIAEKLRPLAAQITKDSELIDKDYDTYAPPIDRLSVTQYLDKYASLIPDPVIRRLIENTVRSEYGVEPDQSSALQLTFILPTVDGQAVDLISGSDEAFASVEGNGQFAEKIASALTGHIQTNKELVGLKSQGEKFQLQFKTGEIVSADMVILAIPLMVMRRIKLEVELPEKLKRVIQELDLGLNEKIIAGFNQRVWQQSNGFSQQIWTDLGFSEAWDDSQRSPELKSGALTYYFGGNEVKDALTGNPTSQGKVYSGRLNTVIPGLEAAANGNFIRTAWTRDPIIRGAYTNFKPGQYTEFAEFRYVESKNPNESQEVHVNNLIFAGEHFSDEYYGYMNGGAQTGRLAAAVVMKLMKKK
jgi:monoamine oxidase